ncbi:MAG: hypothetical protein ACO26C_02180 [Ilumatobacteraceae bacterium]
MAAARIRAGAIAVVVASIAGMIAASIAGNNVGLVTTIGVVGAIAALVLLVVAAVAPARPLEVFEDADAERLERAVASLVAHGADERAVRELVRDATRLGARATR